MERKKNRECRNFLPIFDIFSDFLIAHDEVNVHCSPAKEVFFHNSQFDNERLLEKSQNPREIRTCSLPIARHKR